MIGFVPRILALLTAAMVTGCALAMPSRNYADATPSDTTLDSTVAQATTAAPVLSAFFGLDNGLPANAGRGICDGAGGQDGMPVIFGQELSRATLQAGDFRVTTRSGQPGRIVCVTLAPAIDPGELRTVLLVGEFGSATTDPPATLEIVGNVASLDGTANFKGARREITPLAPGPTLVLAEPEPESQWRPKLGKPGGATWGEGSGCPLEGTVQVVRATWAGGVTRPDGGDIGDLERSRYRVGLKHVDGSHIELEPFALGDLNDGDNNHDLCLNAPGTPVSVSFAAGYLVDPNGDLNPDTRVEVASPR